MKIYTILKSLFLTTTFFFLVVNGVSAIDFPTKPINLVVCFAAGGSTDIIVRAITDRMSEKMGVPVVLVNKPGSGGLIGGEFVAKSKPDGYNVLVLSLAHICRQVIDPKMPFDVVKDFEPICLYVGQPIFIIVNGDSKFKTIEDLIDFAKKNPGKLSLGSAGIGATSHFSLELMKAATKINFKHVPFAGEGPAITAVMGGHIDGMAAGLGAFLGKALSGDLKALVTFDDQRVPELKDVPTFKEKGYPEAYMYSWFSFAAPAGTPKEIIEKLDNGFRAAIKDPASEAAIKKLYFRELYMGHGEFKPFVKSELEKFDKIAKSAGITVK